MTLRGRSSSTVLSKMSGIQAQTEAQFLATLRNWDSFLPLKSCFSNTLISEARLSVCLRAGTKWKPRYHSVWNSQRHSQEPLPFPKRSTWSSLRQEAASRVQVILPRCNPKVFPWVNSYYEPSKWDHWKGTSETVTCRKKMFFFTETHVQLIWMAQWVWIPQTSTFTALHIC